MATNQRNRLNYQPGMGSEGTKTIHRVVPVDLYLAAGVTDGEGKMENRLVFRFPGNKQFYFMFSKGAEAAMKPAAGWLQELLEREIGSAADRDAPIPDDLVTDVPVGDPMEG
jgi:hypothetical protein